MIGSALLYSVWVESIVIRRAWREVRCFITSITDVRQFANGLHQLPL